MSSAALSPSGRQKLAGNLVIAAGTSVWATHFIVTAELLATWDPYYLTAGRLLSGTCFLLTAYLVQSGGRVLRGVPVRVSLVLGILGIAFSTILMTIGIRYSGAVASSIIAAASPIIAAFVARFIFNTPLAPSVLVGAAVAVGGGVLAAMPDGAEAAEFHGGEILVFLGIALFTWYSAGAARWMPNVSRLGVTAVTIAIGALAILLALPFLTWIGLAELRMGFTWREILLILYLGAGPASVALFTWHWGVSRIGVTIASIYSNLVPIVVVLISMLEGEQPTTGHLIGGLLIICGVLVAQLWPLISRRLGIAT
jgi:drug/metabolite transporter (DMT)-like permease